MRYAALAALGFLLDALLGDPAWLPHPVCGIGALVSRLEKLLRRWFPATPRGETAAGVLLWLCVTGASFGATALCLAALGRVSPWLRLAAEAALCGLILARRGLAQAARHVGTALAQSLDAGREAVGWYVGRDTSGLDEKGVLKAAVETVAENTTDGVIAPLLFLLLGGRLRLGFPGNGSCQVRNFLLLCIYLVLEGRGFRLRLGLLDRRFI